MNEPYDELLILTHRYLAGELAGAESDRFEERLAADLTAQEALADAVLLQQAVIAVLRDESKGAGASDGPRTVAQPVPRTRSISRIWAHSGLWLTGVRPWLTGAALLGLAVIIIRWESRDGRSLSGMGADPRIALKPESETVAVWAELALAGRVDVGGHGRAGEEDSWEADTAGDTPAAALEVPDWLFAAVDAVEARSDETSPESPDAVPDEETL